MFLTFLFGFRNFFYTSAQKNRSTKVVVATEKDIKNFYCLGKNWVTFHWLRVSTTYYSLDTSSSIYILLEKFVSRLSSKETIKLTFLSGVMKKQSFSLSKCSCIRDYCLPSLRTFHYPAFKVLGYFLLLLFVKKCFVFISFIRYTTLRPTSTSLKMGVDFLWSSLQYLMLPF